VHKPRGVGLMHARRRPSKANYTHDPGSQRKRMSQIDISVFSCEFTPPARWRELPDFAAFEHDVVDPLVSRAPRLAGADPLPPGPTARADTGTFRGSCGDQRRL
jgi:hypothetical protein